MEREKIKELLRKYYDGLTSPGEEELLRDMQDSPEAAEEFSTDKIVLSVGGTKVPEPSPQFMRNLEAVTLHGESGRSSRRLYRYALSVAAGIALMLGSYYIFRIAASGEPEDTYNDPELAMAEVRNILLNVSQNLNTGTGALKSINTMNIVPGTIDEMGRRARSIDRSLSRLRYLNDLDPAMEVKNQY